jgi:hypothetical protein
MTKKDSMKKKKTSRIKKQEPPKENIYKRGRTEITGSDTHNTILKYMDMCTSILVRLLPYLIAIMGGWLGILKFRPPW